MEKPGDKYEYQPLPTPTSIRTIKFVFKPNADGDSDDWAISFHVVDLLDEPRYRAMSYTWGTDKVPVSVAIDGQEKTVMVTRSVPPMLERFMGWVPDPIWVDALCINQDDNEEKSRQVALMAEIYGKAACVMVWLGPDLHDDGPDTFGYLKLLVKGLSDVVSDGARLSHYDHGTEELHWTWDDEAPDASRLSDLIDADLPFDEKTLVRLFSLPWFSRTWIIQEVGLAKKVQLFWGKEWVGWNVVGVYATFMVRFAGQRLSKLGLSRAVENVLQIYMMYSPFTPLATFTHLLHQGRRFNASDPRDKVFAFLSHPLSGRISIGPPPIQNVEAFSEYKDLLVQLLPDFASQWMVNQQSGRGADRPKLDPLVKADYSKSTTEVYKSFTRDYIERTESLEILTLVQHRSLDVTPPTSLLGPSPIHASEAATPTWVPRLDQFIDTPILGLSNSNHLASANRRAIVQEPRDPSQLIVRGKIISKVVTSSSTCHAGSFDIPTHGRLRDASDNVLFHVWFNTGLAEVADTGEPYTRVFSPIPDTRLMWSASNEETLMSAYMHTWTAGKNMSEVDGFDFREDFQAYFTTVFLGGRSTVPGLPAEVAEKARAEFPQRAERFRKSAAEVSKERKFFLVKKGLFGLGPAAMRAGDWVAILLGADVPFVVREVGGEEREPGPFPEDVKFQLVGECYVHGLMTGNAIRGQEVDRDIILI